MSKGAALGGQLPAPVAERLERQLLAGPPASSPVAVCDRLLAVQAQDLRGARLAIRARSTGMTAAGVDRALGEDRTLLVTWLNRGTLHLVRSDDYPWLLALTAPLQLKRAAAQLSQLGVTPAQADRAVDVVAAALEDAGPLTREVLRERMEAAGLPVHGAVTYLILVLAGLRGVAVRGPVLDDRHAFALVRDWCWEPVPAVDRGAALGELARRYLAGHAPASDRDLARWAGLGLRDVRAGLASIAAELHQRPDGLLELEANRFPDRLALAPPKLLGPWEPVMLGWSDRTPITGGRSDLITSNGIFRPFALVDGRAAARWRLADGRIDQADLADLPLTVAAALSDEAADVERFLRGSSW